MDYYLGREDINFLKSLAAIGIVIAAIVYFGDNIMNLDELYRMIEEECKICEDALHTSSEDDRLEAEGYVKALHWVMSVIEEINDEEL